MPSPALVAASQSERSEAQARLVLIRQHVGWLKMYVAQMNAGNWGDMQRLCEAQLLELSKVLRPIAVSERYQEQQS